MTEQVQWRDHRVRSSPNLSVGMIEVKPGRQEFGAALAKAGSSPWAEAAAERRQEGAPGFYMGH